MRKLKSVDRGNDLAVHLCHFESTDTVAPWARHLSDSHQSNVKAYTSIEETEEHPLQLSLITGTKIDNESYRV